MAGSQKKKKKGQNKPMEENKYGPKVYVQWDIKIVGGVQDGSTNISHVLRFANKITSVGQCKSVQFVLKTTTSKLVQFVLKTTRANMAVIFLIIISTTYSKLLSPSSQADI